MNETLICAGCGARLQPGTDVCDLCGWSVTDGQSVVASQPESGNAVVSTVRPPDASAGNVVEAPEDTAPEDTAPEDTAPSTPSTAPAPRQTAGSGAKTVDSIETSAADSGVTNSNIAGRSAFLVAAAAALLVAGLYLITVVSRSSSVEERPAVQTVNPTPPPLSGSAKQEADALATRIESATGLDKVELQRGLIGVYVRENRLDLAGDIQEDIAVALDSEIEWVRSGNLYYDWMELQGSALRTAYARKAIASYTRALEINPDNLDARTDMALAYFYDPQRPMDAIRNITMVLEADSTHIQANYNRGYLLFQIGRYDQSVEQFEKVLRLVANPEDPIYRRAESALQTVRQRMSAS